MKDGEQMKIIEKNCLLVKTRVASDVPGKKDVFVNENGKWKKIEIKTDLEHPIQYGEFNVMYWIWKNCKYDKVVYLSNNVYPNIWALSDQGNDDSQTGSSLNEPVKNFEEIIKQDKVILIKKKALGKTFKQDIVSRLFSPDNLYTLVSSLIEHRSGIKKQISEILLDTNAYNNLSMVICKQNFNDMMTFVFTYLKNMEQIIEIDRLPIKYINPLEILGVFLINVYIKLQLENGWEIKDCIGRTLENEDLGDEDLSYRFDENEVVIILSSSDYFAPYLGVCIQSILQNTSSYNKYDIIVFEREITNDNKKKILELSKISSNVSIRFFNIKKRICKYNFFLNSSRISQETYYGLLIPWLLPKFKKAIIMDCDMIVKQDLAELYFTELENCIGAGVRDIVLQGWLNDVSNDTAKYYREAVGAQNPFNYVNGGLILLDFDRYRKEIDADTILYYINNYKFRVVDQDIFNYLLEGKMKALDQKWNHMICASEAIRAAIENAPFLMQQDYFRAKESPAIIHYASENKPWLNPSIEFASEFWKHARTTPFYEECLVRMMSNFIPASISTLQNNPANDERTVARIFADTILPKGTRRREFAKRILPKGTKRWKALKKVYFAIFPQYDPNKTKMR